MVVLSHDAGDSSLAALIEAAHEVGHAVLGPWFAPGHPAAAAALLAAGVVLACAGGYLHQPLAALPGIATGILLPLGNLMSEAKATAFALWVLRGRFPDRGILALIERYQKTERTYLLLETAGWAALLFGAFVLAYSVGGVFAKLLA